MLQLLLYRLCLCKNATRHKRHVQPCSSCAKSNHPLPQLLDLNKQFNPVTLIILWFGFQMSIVSVGWPETRVSSNRRQLFHCYFIPSSLPRLSSLVLCATNWSELSVLSHKLRVQREYRLRPFGVETSVENPLNASQPIACPLSCEHSENTHALQIEQSDPCIRGLWEVVNGFRLFVIRQPNFKLFLLLH